MINIRTGPSITRRAILATAVVAVASGAGCTRCLGVFDCVESPRLAVSGRIIDGNSGQPIVDASVELVAAFSADRDSTLTRTSDRGGFQLSLPARSGSPVVALRVRPREWPGYDIPDLECGVRDIRGDGCVLDPILPAPWIPILTQLQYRQGNGLPAPGVRVVFTRTGGSTLFGPGARAVYESRTDETGFVTIFPRDVYTSSLDPVVGDLSIELPAPFGTEVRRNLAIIPRYRFLDNGVTVTTAGPSLAHAIEFRDSTTNAPLAGVLARFTRVGGIDMTPNEVSSLSDSTGLAVLTSRPLGRGTTSVVIDVQARGGSTTLTGISLGTFESDSARVFARYRVGAGGRLYPSPAPNR